MPGEGVAGTESARVGGLADDLGRGQGGASADGEQGRGEPFDPLLGFILKYMDLLIEPQTVLDQNTREPGDNAVELAELVRDGA